MPYREHLGKAKDQVLGILLVQKEYILDLRNIRMYDRQSSKIALEVYRDVVDDP
jgi:hypothetical protein